MEKLLRVKGVAGLCDVTDPTVYTWVKRGYLTAIKLGGRLRFRVSDVEKFIDDRNTAPLEVTTTAKD
jgi:excisionase family DNA binding protein